MKTIVRIEPEALHPPEAARFIAVSRTVLRDAVAAGWIKPCVCRTRLVSYRPAALRLLLNRIEREGLPPKARCRADHSTAAAPPETPPPHPVSRATI
jgi:hypothetical protein